jgi:hypothetical protein
LTESCASAAEFLREKNEFYNDLNKREDGDRLYSSEAQFVAEVYHLLVEMDKSYRMHLFVNYLNPEKGERVERKIPDLVYRNGQNAKSIVEVKAPIDEDLFISANESLNKKITEFKLISKDYKKLKEHYLDFSSKFLVIAYLGDIKLDDGSEFPHVKFIESVRKEFKSTKEIKVIVC